MKPLLTTKYPGISGVDYILEYFESDTFDHLPQDKIQSCYAVAFHRDKFLLVNNIEKPGSYTLIGGSVEEGENPDETLIREIKEESNMKVLDFKLLGYQKVIDTRGTAEPIYQLRYFCTLEPYGPFIKDPAGKVTEIVECDLDNYKKYMDWGEIGDYIIKKATDILKNN